LKEKESTTDNRSIELVLPLYTVTSHISLIFSPDLPSSPSLASSPSSSILEALHQLLTTKKDTEQLSLEAEILRAIQVCYNENKLMQGRLLINEITDVFNIGKITKNEKFSNYSISKQCRKLGFQPIRTALGSAIYWNQELYDKLVNRYIKSGSA
jgi:hypothetical protein